MKQQRIDKANLAPVLVFGFNRADLIEQSLESLSSCYLAKQTDVYIFLDGPRSKNEKTHCLSVLASAKKYKSSFGRYEIEQRSENLGLAKSLRKGIDQVFERYDRLIVLEDDLVVSEDFLSYMNFSLNCYQKDYEVGSISGFTIHIKKNSKYDNYFHPRPSSWGWSTWRDRWQQCDWKENPKGLIDSITLRYMSLSAGQDIYRMYRRNAQGKINSWAILWTIFHIRQGWKVSFPYKSKVINAGFGLEATHCKGRNPFPHVLDMENPDNYDFDPILEFDDKNLKRVNWYHSNLYKVLFKLRVA